MIKLLLGVAERSADKYGGDFDQYTKVGLYTLYRNDATNAPVQSPYGILVVLKGNQDWIVWQLYAGANGVVYSRNYEGLNSKTWTSWKQVAVVS